MSTSSQSTIENVFCAVSILNVSIKLKSIQEQSWSEIEMYLLFPLNASLHKVPPQLRVPT